MKAGGRWTWNLVTVAVVAAAYIVAIVLASRYQVVFAIAGLILIGVSLLIRKRLETRAGR